MRCLYCMTAPQQAPAGLPGPGGRCACPSCMLLPARWATATPSSQSSAGRYCKSVAFRCSKMRFPQSLLASHPPPTTTPVRPARRQSSPPNHGPTHTPRTRTRTVPHMPLRPQQLRPCCPCHVAPQSSASPGAASDTHAPSPATAPALLPSRPTPPHTSIVRVGRRRVW